MLASTNPPSPREGLRGLSRGGLCRGFGARNGAGAPSPGAGASGPGGAAHGLRVFPCTKHVALPSLGVSAAFPDNQVSCVLCAWLGYPGPWGSAPRRKPIPVLCKLFPGKFASCVVRAGYHCLCLPPPPPLPSVTEPQHLGTWPVSFRLPEPADSQANHASSGTGPPASGLELPQSRRQEKSIGIGAEDGGFPWGPLTAHELCSQGCCGQVGAEACLWILCGSR